MSSTSSIEWTDATWNPTRGCDKVSAGCKHCYAETFAERWRGVPGHAYEQGFDLRLAPEQLGLPLRWRKAKRIFVNSMSDLFHEDVTNEYIAAVFGVMAACPQHTFQVLTKRAERLPRWFAWMGEHDDPQARMHLALGPLLSKHTEPESYIQGEEPPIVQRNDDAMEALLETDWPLPNVWLGVSAENQETADERIPHLLATPAAVRFVSAEPLLGPVDLTKMRDDEIGARWNALQMGLHWVIVGGESGAGARPFDIEWGRSIVAQCRAEAVPVFVKQLGARPGYTTFPGPDGETMAIKLRSKKGGDMDEWPADLRVREFPGKEARLG